MGNALLFGLPASQLSRLQMIQNNAARLVTGTPRYEHISPVLHKLHWLPVEKRIMFKVLLQVYKIVNHLAPVYLTELIEKQAAPRSLRSATAPGHMLAVPRTHTAWGDRSFHKAAPQLWNALPVHLRQLKTLTSFKCGLKTHLFKLSYN